MAARGDRVITPRNVRRALLRAAPLPPLLGGAALAVGVTPGQAISIAALGLAPGLALVPEAWAEAKAPARTTSNEVALALVSWLVSALALLALTAQGLYFNAMLSNVDPSSALQQALTLPKPAVLVAVGYAALPFAATSTLLGSNHLRGLDRLPGYGLWALGGVWALLAVPMALVLGGSMTVFVNVSLIPIMAVAFSITNLLALGADALERRLWSE